MDHVTQTISVRRRSMPLKQSQYPVPDSRAFSSSLVVTIMAIVWSTLKVSSAFLAEVRERRDFLASSVRPLRTSHL